MGGMLVRTMAERLAIGSTPEVVDAARPIVRAAFLDTVGCVVAGRRHVATQHAAQWARTGMPPGHDAAALLGASRVSVRSAAFLDAVAAHAWELDDAGLASHPSAVLVPVIMAEAERLGVVGDPITRAYVDAYQVWSELNRRTSSGLHALGWHPTAVFGPIAAAAAVASVRRLDRESIEHALGIAASMSAGVVANFGTMTKALQVGFAAERGILAVDLAQAGVTSAPGALNGSGGLLPALDQADFPDMTQDEYADEVAIMAAPPTVKKYPICLASHRVIDGLLQLMVDERFGHTQVEAVDAVISEASAEVLRRGQNGPGGVAQFSLEFAIATALVHGRIGLAEADPKLVDDPVIQGLMSRVTVHTTNTQSADEPSFAAFDQIAVDTTGGRRLESGEIHHVRGSVKNPLLPGELDRKVRACLEFGESNRDRIEEVIDNTERLVAPLGLAENKR